MSTIILKLHKKYDILPNDFFDSRKKFTLYNKYFWPKNPGVTVFNESGYSFLDASFMFAAKVWLFARQTFKSSLRDNKKKANEIIIEPEICNEVCQWEKELSKILFKYMPVTEWSDSAIEGVRNSLLYKIDEEQEIAFKTQLSSDADYQKALAQTKSQEKGEETETGFQNLHIFKESVEKLIKQGEGHFIEFKATLEYDIKENQHNKGLNKECLKTIAAFLNTDGGVLLIGVKDDGIIFGIEEDLKYVQRKNTDGFELKLRSLIRNQFDPEPLGKLKIIFRKIKKTSICRIDIVPASLDQVIHLDNEVYVRDGNTTIKLTGRKLTDWIQHRNSTQ
ncbi:MAG: ATP-binding protein [Sedimentisphaerales bacterium]|nr:ATP-binding protein [Sedimentisphaerales bacterium]